MSGHQTKMSNRNYDSSERGDVVLFQVRSYSERGPCDSSNCFDIRPMNITVGNNPLLHYIGVLR